MATTFNNILKSSIGTTPYVALTSASNERITVIGLSLTNMTSSIILVNVLITNNTTLASAYYCKDLIIAPNQSLRLINGGERLVVGSNYSITISSSIDASADLVMSYVTIV